MNELKEEKFNLLVDGQFGSTGKGLMGAYLSLNNNIDMYISNLSPNAGHTYTLYDGRSVVVKQLPVGAVINKRSGIYLSSGSIINPDLLLEEIERFNIDHSRIFIHPRAAIVNKEDVEQEKDLKSSVSKIASTQSGVGSALANKIMRKSELAQNVDRLKCYIKEIDLMDLMDEGCTIFMETSQGFDLGLNYGLSYPHCTSRDMTVSSIMSDAGVHPNYLGTVTMTIRTYPIRVGHIYDSKGNLVGHSGPFYSDSKELSWGELGQVPEKTTVTKRIRRVATFSQQQYNRALHFIRPDWVFLNFCNYIKSIEQLNHLKRILKQSTTPTHLGFGPSVNDIYRIENIEEFTEFVNANIK